MARDRVSIVFVAVVFLVQALVALAAPASTLKVPDSTPVRLSLMDTLSSGTNGVDDPVHFEVTEDVKVGDVVAIPKGSTASGHVVEVEPRRRLGRSGTLNFAIDYVKAPDGTNLRLRASSTRKGEDKTGTVIVGSVLLSPLFLIMRGKDINIPKGTQFNAYVDGDREIAMGDASATSAVQTAQSPPAPQTVSAVVNGVASPSISVTVSSTPTGADITVDGKFVGSTPSSLQVGAGDHTINIEKSGFKTWQRTITLMAGSSPTIDATLEKQ
jgi:hypothetical protein